MRIPKDLEILRVYHGQVRGRTFPGDDYYIQLLNSLSDDDLRSVLQMAVSVKTLVQHALTKFHTSQQVPTGDDAFLDFLDFCLSLPRKRIEHLIADPCGELTMNRVYYVVPSGETTFREEGGLISKIFDVFEERFGGEEFPEPSAEEAKSYLRSYDDILSRLFPPYTTEFESACGPPY